MRATRSAGSVSTKGKLSTSGRCIIGNPNSARTPFAGSMAAIRSPSTTTSSARRSKVSSGPCNAYAPRNTVPLMETSLTDAQYMDQALREAQDAFTRGDWPVGSVLVRDGVVLATGQNRQNTERDVTWHAEFEAMRRVTRDHGLEKLAGATVYSTMEPCPMCAGAMTLA